jgi:hypothetical protein
MTTNPAIHLLIEDHSSDGGTHRLPTHGREPVDYIESPQIVNRRTERKSWESAAGPD